MGFHHVAQAGLELLTSSDPPTSASQSPVITGALVFAVWKLSSVRTALARPAPGLRLQSLPLSPMLTATSTSPIQAILLPQPPEWLGLQSFRNGIPLCMLTRQLWSSVNRRFQVYIEQRNVRSEILRKSFRSTKSGGRESGQEQQEVSAECWRPIPDRFLSPPCADALEGAAGPGSLQPFLPRGNMDIVKNRKTTSTERDMLHCSQAVKLALGPRKAHPHGLILRTVFVQLIASKKPNPKMSLTLLPRLKCIGVFSAHCSLCLLDLRESPASAPRVAETTGVHHHTQLIFVFFVEMGCRHVDQAGPELVPSNHQTASASQRAVMTDMSHCAQPALYLLMSLTMFNHVCFSAAMHLTAH
ncbi:hypothetical protein AAY473_010223 [Plecturocebus cupreus]